MIQSFTGTFDARGIRTLRIEDEDVRRLHPASAAARFWAVLDSQDVPMIRHAMIAGDRIRALKLLSDHALSIGSIPQSD